MADKPPDKPPDHNITNTNNDNKNNSYEQIYKEINAKVSFKDARKIRVHSTNETKKLGALHPREIKKFLLQTIGKPKELKVQRNGDMLIITLDEVQTKKLLEVKTFCNIPVEVSTPSGWNCSQGVINGYGLHKLSADDIIECSDETDRIIAARHFPRINNITKNKENSNSVLITFDNKILPTHVYIGFERFPVSQYIMKPLRCFNCQKFGHHVKKCTKTSQCAKCNSSEHTDKDCKAKEEDYNCHNCQGKHTAWSKDCPKFIQEQKVCEYKVVHDVSFFEARQAVLPNNKKSWAAVAAKPSISIETQTYLSFDTNTQTFKNLDYQTTPNEDIINTAFIYDKSGRDKRDNKKAYDQNSKPVPRISSYNYQSEQMSSDTDDNANYNLTRNKPHTPMRNYTPRDGHSDRDFNPEFYRPNTSRSPPFRDQKDKRKPKNRRVMTESEIEEEYMQEHVRTEMIRRQTDPLYKSFPENAFHKKQ